MVVKLWRTLPIEEKRDFMVYGYSFFPEILGSSSTKYERFSLWLASCHSVVSTSMRDTFSAGGQDTIVVGRNIFERVPQTICKIFELRGEISLRIISASDNELKELWQTDSIKEDRISQWIELVASKAAGKIDDVEHILRVIFNR